jgi:AbrB family looped-hinge helix DNA binding protein
MKVFRTTISSKGQVVIPASLRQEFKLKQGTAANWTKEGGRLVLSPITEKRLDEMMGCLKPKPGEPSMFETLFEERRREREQEKK